MREKLREYIEGVFSKYPNSSKVNELKEEILSNMTAKYDDIVAQGRSEEDAYKIAIGGIGDVDELIKGLENEKIYNYAKRDSDRKRSAAVVSTAVGLYIISVAAVIFFSMIPGVGDEVGAVIMFVIAAIATSLLVYNAMSRPKYKKADDTIVEEFKEWKSSSNHDYQAYRSIMSAYWLLVVAIYLIFSFAFCSWPYSWIIFLIAAAVQNIIKFVFESRRS